MIIDLKECPALDAPMFCYSCGTGNVEIIRDDYAVCSACEDRFQAAMQAEYPFGQCYECGAAGFEWTCNFEKVHVDFMHVEGACGQWRDSAEDDCGCPRVHRGIK